MEQMKPHGMEPGPEGSEFKTVDGAAAWVPEVPPFPFVGSIVLEHGQTLTAWMTAHGVTEIPEDTVIHELSS